MEKPILIWSDDFLCGNKTVDNAHKNIISKAAELRQFIAEPERDISKMTQLVDEITQLILTHMETEIDLLKEADSPDWPEHELDHQKYKEKFDLKKNYSLSAIMRVLMVDDMVRDYMENHFVKFDLKDLSN